MRAAASNRFVFFVAGKHCGVYTPQGAPSSSSFIERGAEVIQPVLLQYYRDLPIPQGGDNDRLWVEQFQASLEKYKHAVRSRYGEGTLLRLLDSDDAETRQAAVLALGMIGTMRVNETVARLLHDEDETVRHLTGDALWSLWFRGGNAEQNRELQRLMRLNLEELGPEPILAAYEALLKKAPRFAEVYNQRAILYFRLGDMNRAIADCTMVMRLNPFHFGAASGMAQCYMKLKKLRAALRAYRRAFRINPHMDGIEEVIQSLEKMLGEGRK
jgi:tetratricopeptide (TPR) repeat protein